MKKQLLLLALSFCSYFAMAGCRLDTIYLFDISTTTQVKTTIDREIYTYNNKDSITQRKLENWNAPSQSWAQTSSDIFVYDANGNKIETILEFSGLRDRYLVSLNANNKKTYSIHFSWNGSTNKWDSVGRSYFTYDINKNLVQDSSQVFGSGWVNLMLFNFSYDVNGNKIMYLYQDWNTSSNAWVANRRETYTFNGASIQLDWYTETWTPATTTWNFISKHDFINDANGNKIEDLYQVWSTTTNSWINVDKTLFTYNAKKSKTTITKQLWSTSTTTWVPNLLTLTTYNANETATQEVHKMWNSTSNVWVNQDSINNIFNGQGKQTIREKMVWNTTGNVWEKLQLDSLNYTVIGDLVSADYYTGFNSTTNLYGTHGRLEYFCSKVNVGINDISETYRFSIYPNPVSSNFITINSLEKADYALIDLTGKLLQSGDLNAGENQLPLNDISAGVYFLKIGNETRKIMVQ